VRSKSPITKFSKEKREAFTVKEELSSIPVSYLKNQSTISKGKVRVFH